MGVHIANNQDIRLVFPFGNNDTVSAFVYKQRFLFELCFYNLFGLDSYALLNVPQI